MHQNVQAQIAALRGMSPAQLRDRYLQVFGEATRTGNREFLYKRLAWRLQSQAEGTLSERARQRAAELARDADIRTTMPRGPATTPGPTTRVVAVPLGPKTGLPMPGTILTRKYRGRVIEVTVLPKGFDYDGEVYRSLSAVAKVFTGSHWNGHLFFGLKGEGEK